MPELNALAENAESAELKKNRDFPEQKISITNTHQANLRVMSRALHFFYD